MRRREGGKQTESREARSVELVHVSSRGESHVWREPRGRNPASESEVRELPGRQCARQHPQRTGPPSWRGSWRLRAPRPVGTMGARLPPARHAASCMLMTWYGHGAHQMRRQRAPACAPPRAQGARGHGCGVASRTPRSKWRSRAYVARVPRESTQPSVRLQARARVPACRHGTPIVSACRMAQAVMPPARPKAALPAVHGS